MRNDSTQEQIQELLKETKKYYNLQKEYLKLTVAEQMTLLLSKLAIVIIAAIIFFVALLFLGLALVHFLNNAINNIGICYAIFALFMVLFFSIFYYNRRRFITIPFARMISQIFLQNHDQVEEDTQNIR